MGHSIGLGYMILTLRELTGLSQSKIAKRVGTGQPAIARLESGRQLPTVNTLLKVASSCGMHLVTLLGILKPAPDGLVDFFVIREPPPWAGEG
jgi:transcriptional regulator with XRE-family HTH domain